MLIGGMPAVVQRWVDTSSPLAVAEEQQSLVATLSDDFSKYATRQPPDRMRKVMLSVPRMLGTKYRYSEVDRDERSSALARALSLLCNARVCHKVIHSAARGVPLASEQNPRRFKVIFMDTGLASAIMGLAPIHESELTDLSRADRGGIGEQLAGQLLRASEHWFMDPSLHYHVREKAGSQAEIDYLIQHGGRILPIEVKAGATGRLKSLHQLMADRRFPLAFRVNSSPPVTTDIDVKTQKGDRARYRLVSIPLYLASEIRRLCDA
jgi:predicted AAA+ superfamily ATPase